MKKLLIAAGLVMTISAAWMASAFTKPASQPRAAFSQQFIYTATSSAEAVLQNINNWQVVDGSHPAPTNCPETDQIPCFVTYQGSNFQSYLNTATLEDLMTIAAGTKSVQ